MLPRSGGLHRGRRVSLTTQRTTQGYVGVSPDPSSTSPHISVSYPQRVEECQMVKRMKY